jgi:hypothetical protein
MLDYEYAETYPSVQPQDVPKVVTVRAWERWLVLRAARAARRAWVASKRVTDWTTELTEEAIDAMNWARENDGESD